MPPSLNCPALGGPFRAASLAFWLHSVIWHGYLTATAGQPVFQQTPWYPAKRTPAFSDALAAVRLAVWRNENSAQAGGTSPGANSQQLLDLLVHAA